MLHESAHSPELFLARWTFEVVAIWRPRAAALSIGDPLHYKVGAARLLRDDVKSRPARIVLSLARAACPALEVERRVRQAAILLAAAWASKPALLVRASVHLQGVVVSELLATMPAGASISRWGDAVLAPALPTPLPPLRRGEITLNARAAALRALATRHVEWDAELDACLISALRHTSEAQQLAPSEAQPKSSAPAVSELYPQFASS